MVEEACSDTDAFEYDVCEPAYEQVLLDSPVSTFKYSIPSDPDSEVSAGFGEWLTNEPVEKSTELPQQVSEHDSAVESTCSAQVNLRTMPRFPQVPRNSYGGIRDCLPPEQLEKWISSYPRKATVSSGKVVPVAQQSLPRTITPEQLQRMNDNRRAALEKLATQKAYTS